MIAEAATRDHVHERTTTEEQTKAYLVTKEDLTKMEVILASSLCAIFLTLKVVFSSIEECRKLRQRHSGKKERSEKKAPIHVGRYCKFCSECCCRCCPCKGLSYCCRMLCCLLPYRLCREFYLRVSYAVCSCEYKSCSNDPMLRFCCKQYVVIVLRVVVSELIVVGIPIAFFAIFEVYCHNEAFTDNSMIRAGYGILFTFPLVVVLSLVHSAISNAFGGVVGWCCHRCCIICSNNVAYERLDTEQHAV